MSENIANGCTHLYAGDGKGKTTAALGLALRALGRGRRVALAMFLKGRETGETLALESFANRAPLGADGASPDRQSGRVVALLKPSFDRGFFSRADDAVKLQIKNDCDAILSAARAMAFDGGCDLLVLDEICPAYALDAVDRDLTDDLIARRPKNLELILTGRNAPAHFFWRADYVTEFKKIKHPFDIGLMAREGIEY